VSFDLGLKPATGGTDAFLGALRHAMRRNPAFTQYEDIFDYDHPDTGVHFQMYLNDPADLRDDDDDDAAATLTLNYARPSLFAHEAADVLSALARDLPLLVLDYQSGGDWAPFDARVFIAKYLETTARFTPDLADRAGDDFFVYNRRAPRALLTYAWTWNRDRAAKDARRKKDGRNIWVPPYEFVDIDGRLFGYVAWHDGVATLFPKTELIAISRSKYPAKAPGFFGKKRPTLEFIPRASADAIMNGTYQTDPVWPDAISPKTDGGRAGQDRFLARPIGSDTICDPIFLDGDDYKSRKVKPFERIKFPRIMDDEYFAP